MTMKIIAFETSSLEKELTYSEKYMSKEEEGGCGWGGELPLSP